MKQSLALIPTVGCLIAGAVAPATLSGCGGEPDSGRNSTSQSGAAADPVGTNEQPITNGTPLSEDYARGEGILRITTLLGNPPNGSVGNCTGTLVRNDMVLTARHCVTTDGQINGPLAPVGSVTLSLGGERSGVRTITRLLTSDAVVLRTSSLFANGASRYDYTRPIGQSTNAFLVGKFVNCYGYGRTGTPTQGQLHTARLKVTGSSDTTFTLSKNSLGQLPDHGDSGGPCFTDDRTLVGVISTGTTSSVKAVGPEVIRGVKGMTEYPFSGIARASSTNASGNHFTLDATFPTGVSNLVYTVTPNWNPFNSAGVYHTHHIGMWHTGSQWSIFNQDFATMSPGPAFNVTFEKDQVLGGRGRVHVANAGNTSGQMTRLDFPELNGKRDAIFFVTPNWQPASVYNNHAVGVYYNGANWYVFNEDVALLPNGAAFNIQLTGPEDLAFIHRATSSSVNGHMTYVNNANLNGQPNATFFVTHNWTEGGALYNPHPIGVWYDTSRSQWAIFNQDSAPMPLTAFNILIRP
jgi:hypothetical protein